MRGAALGTVCVYSADFLTDFDGWRWLQLCMCVGQYLRNDYP